MSTRSEIHYYNRGKIFTIYCHYDGYIKGVGETLFKYYQNPAKIRKLIELGSLSSLGKEVEPKGSGHTFENPEEDVTVAYVRDRKDSDNVDIAVTRVNGTDTADVLREFTHISGEEYSYIYIQKDKTWYCLDTGDWTSLKLLSSALGKEEPSKVKQTKRPKTLVTRESSVKMARELRKNPDKFFIIYRDNTGNLKGKLGKVEDVKKLDTVMRFNWVEFGLATRERPTQENLADTIYRQVNDGLNT